MPRTRQKPTYCHHRHTGQAYCRFNGRRTYLGVWDSPESHALLEDLLERFGRESKPEAATVTVDALALKFLAWAPTYYRKGGKPTSEVHCLKLALRYVVKLFGPTLARNFGPRALKDVRAEMVKDGHCRTSINQHCSRIRRLFKWGKAEEFLPKGYDLSALQAVHGLEADRTEAAETEPVKPVALDHVEAVKPFVTEPVWGAIQFQLATGCRPGEALMIRGCDLTMPAGSNVWEYRPQTHKLQHKRKPRVVYVGPKGQEVVRRFLSTNLQHYLFRPRDVRKPRGTNRQPGERYNEHAFRNVIHRACRKAKIPEWSPNQLRHTFATMTRREAGIDVARVLLGHATLQTTEIYAEADADKARGVVAKLG